MALKELSNNTVLYHAGDALQSLDILMKGSVRLILPEGEIELIKGDVIGVADLLENAHSFTYQTSADAAIISYPYTNGSSLSDLIEKNPDASTFFVNSMCKQICAILDQQILAQCNSNNLFHYLCESANHYKELCQNFSIAYKSLPGLDTLEPLVLEDSMEPWVIHYYESIRDFDAAKRKALFYKNVDFSVGFLLKASQDFLLSLHICQNIYQYNSDISNLLLNEEKLDYFDLFTDLYYRIAPTGNDVSSVHDTISKLMIYIGSHSVVDNALCELRINEYKNKLIELKKKEQEPVTANPDSQARSLNLINSLDVILNYGKCPEERAAKFKKAISQYGNVLDKNATDDAIQKLRRSITASFYEIYSDVFFVSVEDPAIPTIIKMFLYFGYVDETIAGEEAANYLYSIADSITANGSGGVYTLYHWLVAIYEGVKEPSRNEFDTDYTGYVHELKVNGKISTIQEAAMLRDNHEKVLYELQNMFPTVNKITFGRVSTYCPIFSEQNVLKSIDSTLIDTKTVTDCITQLVSMDYSAFYRETLYTNMDYNLPKEYIHVEILPDIILMPNIGTRGVLWQEIEGKRRSTPSRMMLSILCLSDLYHSIIRLTADFRWEMCKRIQGARWNDVSEHSITSDYCDYIQFYKKNLDLSTDAKEKIKNNLIKAKNSFKESFIKDYMDWILFEGTGAPRMNKVVRKILFTYCPFALETRNYLKNNPLYGEALQYYELKSSQKLHHLNLIVKRIEGSGHALPRELQEELEFLQR